MTRDAATRGLADQDLHSPSSRRLQCLQSVCLSAAMLAPSAPSRRNDSFYAPRPCVPAAPSREPLSPRVSGNGDARLLSPPPPPLAASSPPSAPDTLLDLSARLARASEALSQTATPIASPVASPTLASPDVGAADDDRCCALPMLRTSSHHRTQRPRRPALRVTRSEPPARIVRFSDGEVEIGLTWAVDDGDRCVDRSKGIPLMSCSRGPPPVARLSMREAIELQAVKTSALGSQAIARPPSAPADVDVDIRRGL